MNGFQFCLKNAFRFNSRRYNEDAYLAIPRAYHHSTRAAWGDSDATPADAIGEGYYNFFADARDANPWDKPWRAPVALTVGARSWDWLAEFPRSRRSSDVMRIESGNCTWDDSHPAPTTYTTAKTSRSPNVAATSPTVCVMLELNIAQVWLAVLYRPRHPPHSVPVLATSSTT